MLRVAAALAAVQARAGWSQVTPPSHPSIELPELLAQRADEGVLLSYRVRFEMPKDVEDALYKGVAVVFVARAEVYRERWYWSDRLRAVAERRWRLAFQPLTRRWRLGFDGLNQHYGTLGEALSVMQRASRWRIMDPISAGDERAHHVEFSFELDRDELPRPLQFGLSDQSDWTLAVQRSTPVAPAR